MQGNVMKNTEYIMILEISENYEESQYIDPR